MFLPHYPAGVSKEQQELDLHQLNAESKKKDSTALMCRTFAHRRYDIINLQMSIKDIKDRWPALLDVSQVSKLSFCSRVVSTDITDRKPAPHVSLFYILFKAI